MLKFQDINPSKKAVIFELDDVLVPKKDYDLQVYYLFANFIEYLDTFPPAQDMVDFVKKRYEIYATDGMFEQLKNTFGLAAKYKENLALLFTNAKLPLKLLLYKEALDLLQELVVNRIEIYILTAGKPVEQLNKIKQTEWNGLDKYLKVYFIEEFGENFTTEALDYLLTQNKLDKANVLIVGKADSKSKFITGVDFVAIT